MRGKEGKRGVEGEKREMGYKKHRLGGWEGLIVELFLLLPHPSLPLQHHQQ
jgi:hypothetical protein